MVFEKVSDGLLFTLQLRAFCRVTESMEQREPRQVLSEEQASELVVRPEPRVPQLVV